MLSVAGIDSRLFEREIIRPDKTIGKFSSVLGMAVMVRDYETFDKSYKNAINLAFKSCGLEPIYTYYCVNDIKDIPQIWAILSIFAKEISNHIEKVNVFYTLFSQNRLERVKVYGRLAASKRIKFARPTRSYQELLEEHLINSFPGICAWSLMNHFTPGSLQFHLDSYSGHICEAQEELEKSKFVRLVFPSGDCTNPVISTADLLIALLDNRLAEKGNRLLFENIRPALPEFGVDLLVHPILNKHLPKITPVDKVSINNSLALKRPIYWIFKGHESVDSGTLKRSETYRRLLDRIAVHGGCAKLFDKKELDLIRSGDHGVFFNEEGKSIIKTYGKIGKYLIPVNADLFVANSTSNI